MLSSARHLIGSLVELPDLFSSILLLAISGKLTGPHIYVLLMKRAGPGKLGDHSQSQTAPLLLPCAPLRLAHALVVTQRETKCILGPSRKFVNVRPGQKFPLPPPSLRAVPLQPVYHLFSWSAGGLPVSLPGQVAEPAQDKGVN